MDKKTFKNTYYDVDVDVTEAYEEGKGFFNTIKFDMDFTMHYPNEDEKRINTNRISWENEAFGLSDFAKAFNKSLVFEAYSLGNVDKIGCLLDYDQILVLGICYSRHYFNAEFNIDYKDSIELLDSADRLARRLDIVKTENGKDGLLRVYIDDSVFGINTVPYRYKCFEIKRVYSGNYKFGMQVTVRKPNSDEIQAIED